eukprot:8777096-Alexandrium_andersonii.AAC.1
MGSRSDDSGRGAGLCATASSPGWVEGPVLPQGRRGGAVPGPVQRSRLHARSAQRGSVGGRNGGHRAPGRLGGRRPSGVP